MNMHGFDNWIITVNGGRFQVIREWGLSGRFAFLKPLDSVRLLCHVLPRERFKSFGNIGYSGFYKRAARRQKNKN